MLYQMSYYPISALILLHNTLLYYFKGLILSKSFAKVNIFF